MVPRWVQLVLVGLLLGLIVSKGFHIVWLGRIIAALFAGFLVFWGLMIIVTRRMDGTTRGYTRAQAIVIGCPLLVVAAVLSRNLWAGIAALAVIEVIGVWALVVVLFRKHE